MPRNNRVDSVQSNKENNAEDVGGVEDIDESCEVKNKELLEVLKIELKLNYFPNDQTKHIDYVICYTEKIFEGDMNSRSNRKIKQREEVRQKFLNQIKNDGFEIERIVRIDEDETFNYLLLNCSLERYLKKT
jgi:hypothetical protein